MKWSKPRSVGLILVVLTLISTAVLYRELGAYQALQDQRAMEAINQSLATLLKRSDLSPAELAQTFDDLKIRYAMHAPALARMGEMCLQAGWFEKSIELIEAAIAVDPNTVSYGVQRSYAYSLLYQGKLPGPILRQTLALSAAHPKEFALKNILAINAYFTNDYQGAAQLWQQLLIEDHDLTPQRRASLEKAIGKAKRLAPNQQL